MEEDIFKLGSRLIADCTTVPYMRFKSKFHNLISGFSTIERVLYCNSIRFFILKLENCPSMEISCGIFWKYSVTFYGTVLWLEPYLGTVWQTLTHSMTVTQCMVYLMMLICFSKMVASSTSDLAIVLLKSRKIINEIVAQNYPKTIDELARNAPHPAKWSHRIDV